MNGSLRTLRRKTTSAVLFGTTAMLAVSGMFRPLHAQSGADTPSHVDVAEVGHTSAGSTYIPTDSWIYPAALRLYYLGYLPTAYLGLRPWTRSSLAHMLQLSDDALRTADAESEATQIALRLRQELAPELNGEDRPQFIAESLYARTQYLNGPVLNDSFHFGQTVVNDYGRPFQSGFNAIAGYSARSSAGPFSLYVRGELQHAPSANGITPALAATLVAIDTVGLNPALPSIPSGPIAAQSNFRLLEANASVHLAGHEISFGKSDEWMGPAQGGSFAWSNNAENIYGLRINRVEPLYIPGLSRITGLFRYDFLVGSLKGHSQPNDPWIHAEKISFKPTPDIEFGFERTVIWGGKGHVPVTLHTFLRSFVSVAAVQPPVKFSRDDPGARFSTFDATLRLPWWNHLVTLYTDSLVHDNVFPVSNPGRAGFRPGVYLSRLNGAAHIDLRAEATTTDPKDPGNVRGQFLYFEAAQLQGYTNRGFILGDWVGRQSKGGQAWLTWHIRPDQSLQFEYRNAKAATSFIPGGTTQHQFAVHAVLRPVRDVEIKATAMQELWKAPLLATGQQKDFIGSLQVTWYPRFQNRLKP